MIFFASGPCQNLFADKAGFPTNAQEQLKWKLMHVLLCLEYILSVHCVCLSLGQLRWQLGQDIFLPVNQGHTDKAGGRMTLPQEVLNQFLFIIHMQ